MTTPANSPLSTASSRQLLSPSALLEQNITSTPGDTSSTTTSTSNYQKDEEYQKKHAKKKKKEKSRQRKLSTASSSGPRRPYEPSTHMVRSDRSNSRASLMSTRYRYYGRLDPHQESVFRMPDHVVPESFFAVLPFMKEGGQNSFITVFSIWNTMMGTSLLSMPWAVQQAGLFVGSFLLLFMAAIAFYTAYRVVQSPKGLSTLLIALSNCTIASILINCAASVPEHHEKLFVFKSND